MAGNSYIKITYQSGNDAGRKLMINLEPLERKKGIPTADIPIPTLSSENRILIPTGGNQDDFTLSCKLFEESSAVAFDVSSTGVETDRTNVRTIKEQWDFIFDEVLDDIPEGGIFAVYELFLDWNNKTYIGWLQAQSAINNETYTGEVEVRLIFKKGKNPLNFLS